MFLIFTLDNGLSRVNGRNTLHPYSCKHYFHRTKAASRQCLQLAVTGPPTFDEKFSGVGFLFNARLRPLRTFRYGFELPNTGHWQSTTITPFRLINILKQGNAEMIG